MTNRVAVDITEDAILTIKNGLAMIQSMLPALIGLTPNERKSLPKIDVTNKVFVEDAIVAAENNPDLLPKYFKIADVKQDKTGFDRLDEVVTLTTQLAQRLRDTQIMMGSEAFIGALTIYRLMESAARDGVPGAQTIYAQLATRFKEQGAAEPQGASSATGAGH